MEGGYNPPLLIRRENNMLNLFNNDLQQLSGTANSITVGRLVGMVHSGPDDLSKMITNEFGVEVNTGFNTLSFRLPAIDIEVIVTYVNGRTHICIPALDVTKSYSNCSSSYVLDMINKLI